MEELSAYVQYFIFTNSNDPFNKLLLSIVFKIHLVWIVFSLLS